MQALRPWLPHRAFPDSISAEAEWPARGWEQAVEERAAARYAQAPDGASLAFLASEDGPLDLLWLPGVPYPAEMLEEDPSYARFARRLRAFSRCITFDGRGVGASGGDPLESFRDTVALEDLTTVLDAVGCERVVLVGCGTVTGTHAIRFAAAHPDRLSALILIDAHAYYLREPDYPIGIAPEQFAGYFEGMKARWGTPAQVDVLAPSRVSDHDFRQRMVRCARLGLSPENTVTSVRLSFQTDTRDLLSQIRVPTLVLHRSGDAFIHVDAGRYLAEHIADARYVELAGSDYLFFAGDTELLLDEIEEFVTGARPLPQPDRVLATVLFTDIVASTLHAAEQGDRHWREVLDQHDRTVRRQLNRFGGREISTSGDGFLATFDGPGRAVQCACAIRDSIAALGMSVRAGVHTGEVEIRGDDVAGMAVHIGARISALAQPGEVLVSRTVKDLVVGSGITFDDRGEHELRGVPGAWALYAAKD
jgi:class 3 adenylate cyclase